MKKYGITKNTFIFFITILFFALHAQEKKIQSTLLHEMARSGASDDDIRALLVKNYAVDSRDEQNRTPLHWAALYGNAKAAQVLCAQKADTNAKDFQGNTPLHLAVKYNANFKDRMAVIDELLLYDANIYVKNNAKYSPIEDAIDNAYKRKMFKFVESSAE